MPTYYKVEEIKAVQVKDILAHANQPEVYEPWVADLIASGRVLPLSDTILFKPDYASKLEQYHSYVCYPGNWLVLKSDSRTEILSNDYFNRTYKPKP